VEAARRRGAAQVVLAVPVAAPDTAREMARLVDELVCLESPSMMMGVGASYRDFSQTGDAEVLALLGRGSAGSVDEVEVDAAGVILPGTLAVPAGAAGLVLFAHGSGSSRHSPRNREVAAMLGNRGLGTLLFDLLTAEEGADRSAVFDIPLLGRRLALATDWVRRSRGIELPIGYFGSSTGGAAALVAAAGRDDVAAVVSRGGRADLAADRLGDVAAPTLLIVGGEDRVVLDLNREARRGLSGESALEVIPAAGHLFEEPGALERVAELTADWFLRWMAPEPPARKRRRRRWIG
jgi:pimeloyl-ACP methyl ester carboxylesterase